ncbi:unnamed protein product [Periconia digitata]|uniref:Uncharacterized protein n=1 Tax=Periconia digitata TaxID=1303443 RepID=A0A9W4USE2_9PLEO|nr:unnamed protein product [Periconia digitata]
MPSLPHSSNFTSNTVPNYNNKLHSDDNNRPHTMPAPQAAVSATPKSPRLASKTDARSPPSMKRSDQPLTMPTTPRSIISTTPPHSPLPRQRDVKSVSPSTPVRLRLVEVRGTMDRNGRFIPGARSPSKTPVKTPVKTPIKTPTKTPAKTSTLSTSQKLASGLSGGSQTSKISKSDGAMPPSKIPTITRAGRTMKTPLTSSCSNGKASKAIDATKASSRIPRPSRSAIRSKASSKSDASSKPSRSSRPPRPKALDTGMKRQPSNLNGRARMSTVRSQTRPQSATLKSMLQRSRPKAPPPPKVRNKEACKPQPNITTTRVKSIIVGHSNITTRKARSKSPPSIPPAKETPPSNPKTTDSTDKQEPKGPTNKQQKDDGKTTNSPPLTSTAKTQKIHALISKLHTKIDNMKLDPLQCTNPVAAPQTSKIPIRSTKPIKTAKKHNISRAPPNPLNLTTTAKPSKIPTRPPKKKPFRLRIDRISFEPIGKEPTYPTNPLSPSSSSSSSASSAHRDCSNSFPPERIGPELAEKLDRALDEHERVLSEYRQKLWEDWKPWNQMVACAMPRRRGGARRRIAWRVKW